MRTVLVTGGAGFIGSHICDAFIAKGWKVWVVDNFSTGFRRNLNSHATLIEGDIRNESLIPTLAACKPEIIVHTAAQASVRESMANPSLDASVNVVGLVTMLEVARRAGSAKVIFLSSGGTVYGEQEVVPCDENHPLMPESLYGLSKLCGELYVNFWNKFFNVQGISLRLGNVYGPRQNPHGEAGVIAIFSERMRAGNEVVIFGEGNQTRDFLHVSDVCSAVLAAAERDVTGSFNIGTGEETSINKLFRIMAKYFDYPHTPRFEAARSGEQLRSCILPQKARRDLGWEAAISLEEGLFTTAEHYRKHPVSSI